MSKIEEIEAKIRKVADTLSTLRRKGRETMETAVENAAGSPLSTIKEADLKPDDAAIMFYTSGTTGTPKGVILTHRNFCFSGPNIAQNYGLREEDVTIAVLPLVHVFCVASPFFGSLSSGGSVVVLEKFKAELVFGAIAKYKVTWFVSQVGRSRQACGNSKYPTTEISVLSSALTRVSERNLPS